MRMLRRICEDDEDSMEGAAERLCWVRFLQGFTLLEIAIAFITIGM